VPFAFQYFLNNAGKGIPFTLYAWAVNSCRLYKNYFHRI
jgi:hypothetical protein